MGVAQNSFFQEFPFLALKKILLQLKCSPLAMCTFFFFQGPVF